MPKLIRSIGRIRSHRGRRAGIWSLILGLCGPSALLLSDARAQEIETSIESPASVGTVVFPHLYHVDELGFECQNCHHETSAAALRIPHLEYFEDFWVDCESCHRRDEGGTKPQSCGNCHANGTEIADETQSAKVVIHRSCWTCHEVGTGQEASQSCGFCHEVDP